MKYHKTSIKERSLLQKALRHQEDLLQQALENIDDLRVFLGKPKHEIHHLAGQVNLLQGANTQLTKRLNECEWEHKKRDEFEKSNIQIGTFERKKKEVDNLRREVRNLKKTVQTLEEKVTESSELAEMANMRCGKLEKNVENLTTLKNDLELGVSDLMFQIWILENKEPESGSVGELRWELEQVESDLAHTHETLSRIWTTADSYTSEESTQDER